MGTLYVDGNTNLNGIVSVGTSWNSLLYVNAILGYPSSMMEIINDYGSIALQGDGTAKPNMLSFTSIDKVNIQTDKPSKLTIGTGTKAVDGEVRINGNLNVGNNFFYTTDSSTNDVYKWNINNGVFEIINTTQNKIAYTNLTWNDYTP
jgi:hypothetical protein